MLAPTAVDARASDEITALVAVYPLYRRDAGMQRRETRTSILGIANEPKQLDLRPERTFGIAEAAAEERRGLEQTPR